MARKKGTYTLSSNIELEAGAPLDARDRVASLSDLTTNNTFAYPYIGMETYVVSENKKYRLVGSDPTISTNWEEVGSSDIVANPEGSATNNLNKIEIDGTKYNIKDDNAVHTSDVGEPHGVAELDENGKVLSSQMPSYVDDAVEGYYAGGGFYEDPTIGGYYYGGAFYKDPDHETLIPAQTGLYYLDLNSDDFYIYSGGSYSLSSDEPTAITGISGVIYIDLNANLAYRWGGSVFVEISPSVALGETASTAYRGDRGKDAYDHASDENKVAQSYSAGLYKVSVTSEGHIGSATEVQKTDITDLGIPAQDTTYENKAASQGGTDVSLVTTGDKYNWDNKGSDTPTFNQASARDNIASGESQSTLFGKIKKWFADLSDLAFIGKDGVSSTKYLRGDGTWQAFPTLGTAAAKDVAASGNASATQVVMGNDTRLTDSRNAKDVYDWAKASTKPSYSASDVGLGNVPNVSTNDQTPTYSQAGSRANLTSGEKLSVSLGKIMKWFADLGTAAFKNVPSSGNATTTEVVLGSDTRLTDSRNAKDVYDWAKASTKPSYTASEVGALADTTKYAGSSSAGGAATSAAKLTNTSKIGDTNKPVFFNASGVPVAIDYTISKSVPSDAVFTDNNTTYTLATGDANGQIKVTPSSGSAYNVSVKGLFGGKILYVYERGQIAAFASIPKYQIKGDPKNMEVAMFIILFIINK